MPVAVASSARGYNRAGAFTSWSARSVFAVGTKLYVVTQDTGAFPKIRVHKATSQSSPSFAEQDAANNRAITNTTFPFSAWADATFIHVVAFTSTNTLRHYRFNHTTDLWTTDFGNVTTTAKNQNNVRVVSRSDGDVVVGWVDSVNTEFIGYGIYEGTSWTTATVAVAASASDSYLNDLVIDSTDRAFFFFFDPAAADTSYMSLNGANVMSAIADIDATSNLANQISVTCALYDDAGIDKVVFAGLMTNASVLLSENVITLEADAAVGNVSAQTSTGVNAVAAGSISTAMLGTTPYIAYSFGAAGTEEVRYVTKSAGVWSTFTSWKSTSGGSLSNDSVANSGIIQLIVLGSDLGALYQDDTTVRFDFIVGGAIPVPAAGADTGAISGAETATVATTQTVADTGTGTGAETATVDAALTRTDTGTIGGVESGSAASDQTPVSRTDSGALTASEAAALAVTVSIADSGTITGVASAALATTQPIADTGMATGADAVAVAAARTNTDTGTLTGSDAAGATGSAALFPSADILTITLVGTATIAAALSAADALAVSGADGQSVAATVEPLPCGAYSAGAYGEGPYGTCEEISPETPVSASDTGTLSAAQAASTQPFLYVNDSGALATFESISVEATSTISVSDSGTLSGSALLTFNPIAADVATLTLVETTTQSAALTRADVASTSASDAQSIITTITVNRADVATLTLAQSASASAQSSASATDSGTITGVDARSVTPGASAGDTGSLTLIDTATAAPNVTMADVSSLALGEQAAITVTITMTDSALLVLVDQAGDLGGTAQRLAADNATLIGGDASTIAASRAVADAGSMSGSSAVSVVQQLTVAMNDVADLIGYVQFSYLVTTDTPVNAVDTLALHGVYAMTMDAQILAPDGCTLIGSTLLTPVTASPIVHDTTVYVGSVEAWGDTPSAIRDIDYAIWGLLETLHGVWGPLDGGHSVWGIVQTPGASWDAESMRAVWGVAEVLSGRWQGAFMDEFDNVVGLELTRGDTYRRPLTIYGASGAVYDLTGASVWMTIKHERDRYDHGDSDAVISLYWSGAGASGIDVATPTSGQIMVEITPAQTASLDWSQGYWYDVQVKKGPQTFTAIMGPATVAADVTYGATIPLT
jgi:hypothetical protein